eukprot:386570_1
MSSPDCIEHDYLNLANNKKILKMLHKYGNNHPMVEQIILSTKLKKINRKGKSQKRILLITDKAIYNIKPNKLNTCQRRITLETVASITSSKTHEFTIHIPSEYDYRYKSINATQKEHIITQLTLLFGQMTGLNLNVHNIENTTTKGYTVTRIDAKHTSYAAKYERRKILTRNNNSHSKDIIFDEGTTNKTEGEDAFYSSECMNWSNYSLRGDLKDITLNEEITLTKDSITPDGEHILSKEKDKYLI